MTYRVGHRQPTVAEREWGAALTAAVAVFGQLWPAASSICANAARPYASHPARWVSKTLFQSPRKNSCLDRDQLKTMPSNSGLELWHAPAGVQGASLPAAWALCKILSC